MKKKDEGIKIMEDIIKKARQEKKKWHYKRRKPIAQCHLCLNYNDYGVLYKDNEDIKVYNRTVRIGKCMMDGWEVSAIDVCDCWQDDA